MLSGGLKKRRGRPPKNVSLDFTGAPAPIRVPLGPKLVEYGPKRRRGRPRKPIDYLAPPKAPKAPRAPKVYGPKRKPGRPKKFTTNEELDRAIAEERMRSPQALMGAIGINNAVKKIQNAVRQKQAIDKVANLYVYKKFKPDLKRKLNASVMVNDMLNTLMPQAINSIPSRRRGRPPGSKNKPK